MSVFLLLGLGGEVEEIEMEVEETVDNAGKESKDEVRGRGLAYQHFQLSRNSVLYSLPFPSLQRGQSPPPRPPSPPPPPPPSQPASVQIRR